MTADPSLHEPAPQPSHELLATGLLALTGPRHGEFEAQAHARLLLEHSEPLVPADAAGVELADADSRLRPLATTGPEADSFLAAQQLTDGPSQRALATGRAVTATGLNGPDTAWPEQREAATAAGFHALHAVPMREGGRVWGVLAFFRTGDAPFTASQRLCAQSLADAAAIGMAHHDVTDQQRALIDQLQYAFKSRVGIEQAKGIIAASTNIPVEDAFALLRSYARTHRRNLHDVARHVNTACAWPPPDEDGESGGSGGSDGSGRSGGSGDG